MYGSHAQTQLKALPDTTFLNIVLKHEKYALSVDSNIFAIEQIFSLLNCLYICVKFFKRLFQNDSSVIKNKFNEACAYLKSIRDFKKRCYSTSFAYQFAVTDFDLH